MQLLYDNKMPNQQRFSGYKEKQFQHKDEQYNKNRNKNNAKTRKTGTPRITRKRRPVLSINDNRLESL